MPTVQTQHDGGCVVSGITGTFFRGTASVAFDASGKVTWVEAQDAPGAQPYKVTNQRVIQALTTLAQAQKPVPQGAGAATPPVDPMTPDTSLSESVHRFCDILTESSLPERLKSAVAAYEKKYPYPDYGDLWYNDTTKEAWYVVGDGAEGVEEIVAALHKITPKARVKAESSPQGEPGWRCLN